VNLAEGHSKIFTPTKKVVMVTAEELFVHFCHHLNSVFGFGYCSTSALVRLASYFWNRLTDNYKAQWKADAAYYNAERGLTGRRKRRGFWHFALSLEEAMMIHNYSIYTVIWHNLLPEARQIWMFPSETLINHELDHIMSAMNNLAV